MPKIQSEYDQVRVPFTQMSFTPDVPSTQLGPNEYNVGLNVESDVRGVRSMAGDQEILRTIPNTPTYITGGFRQNGTFYFIVATVEGYWYMNDGSGDWVDITPGSGPFTGYTQQTNITSSWNGTVAFFNDALNPPMFLPDEPDAILCPYSNSPNSYATNSTTLLTGEVELTFTSVQASPPFIRGQKITISGSDEPDYNGTFTVTDCTTTTVTYKFSPTVPTPTTELLVTPTYVWNYNPQWKSYTAGFMRLYSTPNVGSILVAGDLTVTDINNEVTHYPVTVQWSQAFGLNQAPRTWEPTITNIANQLEVPLRGQAIDGFPWNGQFFLCSYWDTVVFSPINYATTSTPILGVRLHNQGRGLLSANCWGNTDRLVYGIDARDIWVFDGNNFQGLGNQRVKNWFFDQLDPQYYNRVFMEINTQKNQVEIYYPDSEAIDGVPNKMLSYRYDLELWNSPREVASGTMCCESPIWMAETQTFNGVTSTTLTGSGTPNQIWDITITDTVELTPTLTVSGYQVGDQLLVLGTDIGGTSPANDITITLTEVSETGDTLPNKYTISGTPLYIYNPQYSSRTIVYARGVSDSRLIQKDIGYSWYNGFPIESKFRRDNIKLLKDYSGKLMVHRILPEVNNLGAIPFTNDDELPVDPATSTHKGNVTVTIEGANSIASVADVETPVTMTIDTSNPWCQINQNAYRVNNIEISNTSNNDIWICSATTWQFTQVEDDR